MNGWLIFFGLLAAYIGVVYAMRRSGGKWGGAEVNGPFIMWRTQFGKRWIEKVATPKRFWRVVADVGIVATWLTGLAIFALLIYQLTLYFTAPDIVAQSETSPNQLIGLPGVNPLIPFWYGIAALVLALVIHEGSHGVMAFVGRMRVKSLGLLWFIVPVGAFVEPDDEDLERATARDRNRVFAAGPASNLVLALVAGVILSTAFMGSLALANGGQGIAVANVLPDTGAASADLRAGDIMVELRDVKTYPPDAAAGGNDTAANGSAPVVQNVVLTNATVYREALNWTRAGDSLTIVYLRDGDRREIDITLVDRHEWFLTHAPSQADAENDTEKGFMGVTQMPLTGSPLSPGFWAEVIEHPFASGFPESFAVGGPSTFPGSFFLYISYPFIIFQTQMDIFSEPYRSLFVVEGPLAALPEPVFFGLATLLYWIVWINLMLGTFNALPAGPLDGGQMLRATLRERLMRRYKVDDHQVDVLRAEETGTLHLKGRDDVTQAKLDKIQHVVSRTTWTLGLFILGLILLPLFGPTLLRAFV